MDYLRKAIADLEALQGKLVAAVHNKQLDDKSACEIDGAIHALRLKILQAAARMD
jgi:hypothetical protein